MDAPPPPAPEPSPNPPPPYWRWETFASLGLVVAIIILFNLMMYGDLLNKIRHETLLTLLVSFFTFGIFLGFSGARQGGRANRIVAILAMAFHLLLMLGLLLL